MPKTITTVHPMVTLSSGLRVVNFSSPHAFKFTTGETLPACSKELCHRLRLRVEERTSAGIKGTTDLRLKWKLTPKVMYALEALNENPEVDLVLVPLPVLEMLKKSGIDIGKARCIRTADRYTKTIYPDKFCR